MRAARILADDPNPRAEESLRERLIATSTPITPIQAVSDCTRLKTLSITNAKFREKKRLYDLSRRARLLQTNNPGFIKIRVMKPRAQMMGEPSHVVDAYADFNVEVPSNARGIEVKRAIVRKQESLTLAVTPLDFLRIFVHELGGRSNSPTIGREILDGREIEEYGIQEGLSYDVTVWQNQTKVASRTVAAVLLVDAKPGMMLPEQAEYVDDCRAKEAPCYTNVS